MYRVITAKVTFGNIHALEKNVEHVTTIRNFMPSNSQDVRKSDSKSSLISNGSNEANSDIPTCIVDEEAFKIPTSYRCTNYVMPEGLGARLSTAERRTYPNHYGQGMDEDDILLQLAIQQSLASSGADEHGEEQLTALEILGGQNASNLPSDLREFNERRTVFDQTNDDLMLQRALAASLGETTIEEGAIGYTDESLRQILELSKREEEERRRRELEEDEQLKKILELSLIEK